MLGQQPVAGHIRVHEGVQILRQKETMYTHFSPGHTFKVKTLQVPHSPHSSLSILIVVWTKSHLFVAHHTTPNNTALYNTLYDVFTGSTHDDYIMMYKSVCA